MLCVPAVSPPRRGAANAERRRRHSHAKRGNEIKPLKDTASWPLPPDPIGDRQPTRSGESASRHLATARAETKALHAWVAHTSHQPHASARQNVVGPSRTLRAGISDMRVLALRNHCVRHSGNPHGTKRPAGRGIPQYMALTERRGTRPRRPFLKARFPTVPQGQPQFSSGQPRSEVYANVTISVDELPYLSFFFDFSPTISSSTARTSLAWFESSGWDFRRCSTSSPGSPWYSLSTRLLTRFWRTSCVEITGL